MSADRKQWTLLSISGGNSGGNAEPLRGKFRVRLIEVQLPIVGENWLSTIHSEPELWNGLFGDPDSRSTDL